MSNLPQTQMQVQQNGGQLAAPGVFDGFQILDPHSETGVSAQTAPRANYIATISAGKRNEKGLPDRTKNGEIYIHGDAPALEAALKANGGKSLTVAFPSNDPREFIQQRFAEYSATALLAYGDGNSVTEIKNGERITHQSGTAEYKAVIERCKVSVSVYFMLAEWTDKGADMTFNDGFGLYRLRFTSRNSLQSILFSMQHMAQMTGGQIAGIPFDLFLRKEEHADASGKKRPCWIWQCIPRPPKGIRLDATSFKAFAQHGVQQVGMLQLKAPEPETIDVALADVAEGAVIDLEAEDVVEEKPEPAHEPVEPVMCDARDYQKRYFAVTNGSRYADDDGRHEFVLEFTNNKTNSLSTLLASLTEAQAQAFIDAVTERIAADWKDAKKNIIGYAKVLFGADFKTRLADEIGQKNFDGFSLMQMEDIEGRLDERVGEMKALQQDEPKEPAVDEDGVIDEPEPDSKKQEPLTTPDNPLNAAVHKKLEEAKNPASSALFDELDEADPFADEPANAYAEGAV